MRALISTLVALPASVLLLLGCDRSQPLEPAVMDIDDASLAASASQLAAPWFLDASSPSESQIDVTWRDNSTNETAFELHRSTTGVNGVFTLLATTGPNVGSYSDKAVQFGVQYCYRVRAVRVTGNRTTYSTFSDTDILCLATGAPSSLKAVASSPTAIDLSWQDNSSSETGFEVHVFMASSVPLATTAANATAYTHAGLEPNTAYCHRVRAFRVAGNDTVFSPFSYTVCATTPNGPPAAVPSIELSSYAGGMAVHWAWTSRATSFGIFRSMDGATSWTRVATVSGYDWFYDEPLPGEQQVCYRVVASNELGDAPPSPTACATTLPPPPTLTASVVDAQTLELRWNDVSAAEDGYEVWVYYYRGTMYCYSTEGGAKDTGTFEYEALLVTLPANSTSYRTTPIPNDSCIPPTTASFYVVTLKDGVRVSYSNPVSAAIP